MSDEQINAAIAEACGWTEIRNSVYRHHKPWGHPPLNHDRIKLLPDYCADLNAMHEAENTLSQTNMFVMAHYIEQLVNKNGLFYFRATARQRAEAFLRTLGKWEEVQK